MMLPIAKTMNDFLLSMAVRLFGRAASYSLTAPQVLPIRIVMGTAKQQLWDENSTSIVEVFERNRNTRAIVRKKLRWDGVPNYGMHPENLCGHIVSYFFRRSAREVVVTARNVDMPRYTFDPMDLTKSFYRVRKS